MNLDMQEVNTGTRPGDGTGDRLYVAFDKLNSNDQALASAVAMKADQSATWNLLGLTGRCSLRGIASAQDGCSYYDSVSEKTFVSYLGPDRQLWVLAFDHVMGDVSAPVKVANYPLALLADDHGPPAMTIGTDGYLYIIFGAHDSIPTVCKSTAPRDISEWTVNAAPTGITAGTYHMIECDRQTGDLWIFNRAGAVHSTVYPAHEFGQFFRSTNGGATWADQGNIVSLVSYNGDAAKDLYPLGFQVFARRLYVMFQAAHGAAHDGTRADIFFSYYEIAASTWYTADGVSQGAKIDTLAKLQAIRIRQADVCGGRMVLTAVNDIVAIWNEFHSGLPIELWSATFNGIAWSVNDTGARGHHNFDQSAVRRSATGYEIFACAGRAAEPPVEHPRDELFGYIGCGNSVRLLTSADGVIWVDQGVILDPVRLAFQGAHQIVVPKSAASGMKALILPGAAECDTSGGQGPKAIPLYGLTDRYTNPKTLAPSLPGPREQILTPRSVATPAIPATNAWQVGALDLAGKVPFNCTHVQLLIEMTGTGTASRGIINVRQTGADSNGQAFAYFNSGAAFAMGVSVWCQVSEAKKVDFAFGGTKANFSALKFSLCAVRTE